MVCSSISLTSSAVSSFLVLMSRLTKNRDTMTYTVNAISAKNHDSVFLPFDGHAEPRFATRFHELPAVGSPFVWIQSYYTPAPQCFSSKIAFLLQVFFREARHLPRSGRKISPILRRIHKSGRNTTPKIRFTIRMICLDNPITIKLSRKEIQHQRPSARQSK